MWQPEILWALVRRAFTLLRARGFLHVLRRTFAFIGYLNGRIFFARSVYLYEHSLEPLERTAFLPRLDSWELRILHTNEDADRVAEEGYEDLRDSFVFGRRSLRSGAVAFCVYSHKALVHVGWLAIDARGKSAVDRMPFSVAFDAGQACTGGTYTRPEYRGKGLMPYGYYERFEYLRAKGFTSSRNSVEINNTASHRAHSRFNPTIYGIGHYRKVLWWKRWKVDAFPGGPTRGMPPAPRDGVA